MKKTFTLLFIVCLILLTLFATTVCTEGGGSSGGGSSGGGGDDPASSTAGLIDTTFDPGTGPDNIVYCVAILSDGKMIIGGDFHNYSGENSPFLTRINSDGIEDEAFVHSGINSQVECIAIQSDGKIIIGGMFNNIGGTERNRIARINSDGTLDAAFVPAGTGLNDAVNCASIQSDGKIIIGGDFSSYNGTSRNCIARLNSNGTLDAVFNPGTGTNNSVYSCAILSDGKIIIGGGFISYNGIARNRIARVNSDGTLDAAFTPGSGAVGGPVFSLVIQSDGKIIIGGSFTTYDGTSRNRIARINSDGTLDAAFNPGIGANNDVYSIAIQSDGKIIIGGSFTTYNSTSRNSIARINSDGTLDTTFNPGTGANNDVRCAAIQSNGRIIIGGNFTTYNGTTRNRIARVLNN